MATIADVVRGSYVRHGFLDPSYRAAVGLDHYGADLAAPVGTDVETPVGGWVIFAGWDDRSGDGGLGVKVRADDGADVGVWHLSAVLVRYGQRVEPGDRIGVSGDSGGAVYPHTHLQVERPPGTPIDPVAYLAGLGSAPVPPRGEPPPPDGTGGANWDAAPQPDTSRLLLWGLVTLVLLLVLD